MAPTIKTFYEVTFELVDQGQHQDTVMVKQDQSFPQQENPEGSEKSKPPSPETIEKENSSMNLKVWEHLLLGM